MPASSTFIVLALLCLGLMRPLRVSASEVHEVQSAECVMLLHGLGRTPAAMKGLEHALARQGYRVVNLGYPSLRVPVDRLADGHLHHALVARLPVDAPRIHFVTHSFGGILLRQYLSNHDLPRLGRVVMLAPPNQGSELADSWRKNPLVRLLVGPNFALLGTAPGDAPKRLGPVNCDLGVIAGDRSVNPFFSSLLPGPNDGKVSVTSTRIDGMRDFLVVHRSHMGIKWAAETQQQAAHFLADGNFQHSLPRPRE